MMPTNDDRRVRPPAPASSRPFEEVRSDLIRVAVAGSRNDTRAAVSGKVSALAGEIRDGAMTPAAVAAWLDRLELPADAPVSERRLLSAAAMLLRVLR